MWEVPRYRIKAYLRQLRKGRSETDRDGKARFHYMKVRGQLAVVEGFGRTPEIIGVSLLLNDLSYNGVWLFSSKPLLPGQGIRLTLQYPTDFFVAGVILSCSQTLRPFSVLSNGSSFPHRVHIKFNTQSTDELVDVRKFVHGVQAKLYPVGNA